MIFNESVNNVDIGNFEFTDGTVSVGEITKVEVHSDSDLDDTNPDTTTTDTTTLSGRYFKVSVSPYDDIDDTYTFKVLPTSITDQVGSTFQTSTDDDTLDIRCRHNPSYYKSNIYRLRRYLIHFKICTREYLCGCWYLLKVLGLVSVKVESECFSTTMVPKVGSVEVFASFNTSRKSPISTLFTSSLKVTFISKSPDFGVIKTSTIDKLSTSWCLFCVYIYSVKFSTCLLEKFGVYSPGHL